MFMLMLVCVGVCVLMCDTRAAGHAAIHDNLSSTRTKTQTYHFCPSCSTDTFPVAFRENCFLLLSSIDRQWVRAVHVSKVYQRFERNFFWTSLRVDALL